jgi:SAM-dependent MidA family methyltransferase
MTLAERIAERIRREGPITFADFHAAALYDEHDGFFSSGRGAGRAGRDFVTSPEVGTLFGALVGRFLDASWQRLGEPDPFVVIEAGAGRGRLAADVLRGEPACAAALRYVLVERSPVLRAQQRELLTLEPADEALGPFTRRADPDDVPEPVRNTGPIVTSIDDLPAIRVEGVVIANELLDNLPIRIVERATDDWSEVRVGLDEDNGFVETLVTAPVALAGEADAVTDGVTVENGARVPVPMVARDWIERVGTMMGRGDLVVVDYAEEIAGLLARGSIGATGWLRTYREHGRGTAPLDAPGRQDVTVDLPLEYLRTSALRAGFAVAVDSTQAEWLRTLGIEALVAEGDDTWRERAHLGDLEAIAGRSRGVEAAALTDPDGLGAHRVLVLAGSGGRS